MVLDFKIDSINCRFFMCEILNFANVVGQIYFMDMFLGYQFTEYGTEVLAMTELENNQRHDPMSSVRTQNLLCIL